MTCYQILNNTLFHDTDEHSRTGRRDEVGIGSRTTVTVEERRFHKLLGLCDRLLFGARELNIRVDGGNLSEEELCSFVFVVFVEAIFPPSPVQIWPAIP